MTNLPVGNIVSLSTDHRSKIAAELDRIAEKAVNAPRNDEADQLRQQLHDERQQLQKALLENGLLRHALRTLSSQVQSAMPALTALVDQRDGLATAWAQADRVMRETGK